MQAHVNTRLLLHEDGDSVDSSILSTKTFADGSGITYSDSVKKFGSHAAVFDGTSNGYQQAANHADWTPAAEEFTFEGWFNWAAFPGTNNFCTLLSQYDQTGGQAKSWRMNLNVGVSAALKTISFQYSTDGTNVADTISTPTQTMVVDTWYHIAVVRVVDTLKIFLSGVEKVSADLTGVTIATANQVFRVGASKTNGFFNGRADEIYMVKGYGAYSEAFTPPASAYAFGGTRPAGMYMMANGG